MALTCIVSPLMLTASNFLHFLPVCCCLEVLSHKVFRGHFVPNFLSTHTQRIRLLQACHKQICCKITTGVYLKLLHACYLTVGCQLQSCHKSVTCLSSNCFDSWYTLHGQPLYIAMTDCYIIIHLP